MVGSLQKKASRGTLGLIFLIAYAIFGGFKDIIVGHQGGHYDIFMMVFVVFGITTLFFQILWHVKRQSTPGLRQLARIPGAQRDLILLNVATMIAWLGTYKGLVLLEPALAAALWGGLAPILMSVGDWLLRGKRPNRVDWWVGGSIMAVSFGIMGLTLSGYSAKSQNLAALGIVLCCFTALGMALVSLFAKRLYDHGCSAVFIMGNRFYVLLIVALLLQQDPTKLISFIANEWHWLVPLTGIGVILSLYLLQEGTRLCQPITVGLIFAISPSATLLAQGFDPEIHILASSVAANLLVVVISCAGVLWHWRRGLL
ncbi:MAG TPA: EamA family transporter [Gammaproteobacteria bacterium]|nr:EamA family transporter [Gammaproteobacteria bacterium]